MSQFSRCCRARAGSSRLVWWVKVYHVEPQRAVLRVLDALEKPEATGPTLSEQLAQLHSLFQTGALTEQMYQAACANILGPGKPSE